MRVLELQVDNFKRVRAVSVTPGGSLVEITGENGEGKTSTLDAIWAALGGKDACPEKPVHSGAADAVRAGDAKSQVHVVLGEDNQPRYRVTRRFKLKDGTTYATDLIVENAEGARFGKPQDVLNTLLGDFAFDPLAFTRLKDAEQVVVLRKLVPGVDFAALDGQNKRDFEERTEVNRKIRDLEGQQKAMPVIAGDLPDAVDTAALEAQLGEAAKHNSDVETRKARRGATQERLAEITAQIAALHEEQSRLEEQLKTATALPDLIDVDEVQRKLAAGREANALRAKAEARQALTDRIAANVEQATTLSAAIAKRKDEASAAVAKAKMPVKGLGFGQDADENPVVTLNGEPFSQASQAEKIRVSVAIAAAMNPKLRVARVADGSLLDRKSWAALAEYAEANDLQVWVETVDAKGPAAVLIEDGAVAVAPVGDVI
jgi:DNA repair exonuclease SbcCD ATPase subunit